VKHLSHHPQILASERFPYQRQSSSTAQAPTVIVENGNRHCTDIKRYYYNMDRDYFQHAVNDAVTVGTSFTTRVFLFATSGVIALYAFSASFQMTNGFEDLATSNDSNIVEEGLL
jgi:hypothetical protein